MMRRFALCLLLIVAVCLKGRLCQEFVHRPPFSMLAYCARNVTNFGIISQSRFRPIDFLLICSFPREIEECLHYLRTEKQDFYPVKLYETHFPLVSDMVQAIYIYCIDIYPKDILVADKIDETLLYPCERKIDFGACSVNAIYEDFYHLTQASNQGDIDEVVKFSCLITFQMTQCRFEEYQKCQNFKLDSFFELLFGILGHDCLSKHGKQSEIWKKCPNSQSQKSQLAASSKSLSLHCATFGIWRLVAAFGILTWSYLGRTG